MYSGLGSIVNWGWSMNLDRVPANNMRVTTLARSRHDVYILEIRWEHVQDTLGKYECTSLASSGKKYY